MQTSDTVLTQIEGSILTLTLNRAEKRNALNDELVLSIEKVFDCLTKEIRCVLIQGTGLHFSAGLDLTELKERNVVEGIQHSRMWHRVFDKIQNASCPVVAVLRGAVVGGGLELASACHIRVSEASTFYTLPEGQRGIYVGGGASVRIPRLIGLDRMMDMMLTGRVYSAEEGERLGFAQYLVAEDHGMEKAKEIALKITSNTSLTNYAITQVLPKIQDMSHNDGLMMESLMAAIAQDAPEAKQRLAEFLSGKGSKIKS